MPFANIVATNYSKALNIFVLSFVVYFLVFVGLCPPYESDNRLIFMVTETS
jgi:hypothetical protein